jgi:hypothetical protein
MIGVMPLPALMNSSLAGSGSGSLNVPSTSLSRTIVPGCASRTSHCALSLMRRPAGELREALSDSVWLRLGQGIASCVVHVADILRAGARDGTFTVEDPDYMANVLWTQILGATHLARIRVGVRQAAPGIPELFTVAPDQLVRTCVASALATVGARPSS